MSIIKANKWQSTSGSAFNVPIQVVTNIYNTQLSMSSTSFVDCFSATITPKQSGSKFYIESLVTFSDNGRGFSTNNNEMRWALKRSDTGAYLNSAAGTSYTTGIEWWGWDAELGYGQTDETNAYSIKQAKHLAESLGSTAGTPITFTLQWKITSANTAFLNRCYQSAGNGAGVSYIRIMEVTQ